MSHAGNGSPRMRKCRSSRQKLQSENRTRSSVESMIRADFWRIAQIALHTGLREAKILEIERSWLKHRDDGCWLILPPAGTKLKGTPRELPLNFSPTRRSRPDVAPIDGRIFHQWSADAFGHQWHRTCKAAKVQDLHFHDLRHTFTTRLQNLGEAWKCARPYSCIRLKRS
jgi:integrase